MKIVFKFVFLVILFSKLSSGLVHAGIPQPIRINCGGFKVILDSVTFERDMYYTGTFAYRNYNIPDIFQTEWDSLYVSERGPDSNLTSFQYHIPLTNGFYHLRLHFAEIYWGAPGGDAGGIGSRIFNVILEGNEIISNFDITKESGVMTAIVKTFIVEISDDTLDLDFIPIKNRGKISAIEILPVNAGPVEVNESKDIPIDFALEQNYPNPFNPSTNITYTIPSKSYVSLQIFDITGKEIATLTDGEIEQGTHNVAWNASGSTSGIYFYRIRVSPASGSTKGFTDTKKLIVVK